MEKPSVGNETADKFILYAANGPDVGKKIYLEVGREYLLGRQADCDIQVDPSDKSVSRKHAVLKITSDRVVIENLSQTNPVRIKNSQIEKFSSKGNDRFEIGNTVFELKKIGSRVPKKIGLMLCVIFLLAGAGIWINLSPNKESPRQGPVPVKSGVDQPAPAPPPTLSTGEIPTPLPATGLKNEPSGKDKDKADELFRQGMFFYDAGHLSRALEQWALAISIDPGHAEARTWFLRTERELEEQIISHYQKAITHYKYMRYEDAAHEFKIVIQLSRHKEGDIYMDSLRYLDELQRK